MGQNTSTAVMGAHAQVAAIKAALPLSDLIGLSVGWDRARSNPRRGDFWAPCPFHREKTPSFHVDDRKGFYYCFGCSAAGDHVSWCRQWHHDDFPQALERLARLAGLAPGAAPPARRAARPVRRAGAGQAERRRAQNRLALASEIWRASYRSSPLLMRYLAARGVAIAALEKTWGGLPPCLRLHPNLEHRQGGRVIWRGPAMVALMSRPGRVAGIHRTWITAEGRARQAGQVLAKQWLGRTGAMMGTPVRFTAHSRQMIVGEGIETTLAAWSQLQLRYQAGAGGFWSAEAALSLGALTGSADPRHRGPVSPATGRVLSSAVPDMARPAWQAPDFVERLIILAEGSARDPAEARARAWCAQRRHQIRSDGRARLCKLVLPPGGWGSGHDFADLAAGVAA